MDTSHIDLMRLIPTQLKKHANTNGGEYAGACPICGGKDRFIVTPSKGTWYCRKAIGHRASGDAITFMMEYHRLDYPQACEALGIQLERKSTQKRPVLQLERVPVPVVNEPPPAPKPAALVDTEWQLRARNFTEWAWNNLQHGNNSEIEDYLFSRGINDYMADIWMLGWNPRDWNLTWGKTDVYIPKGLVIPWLDRDDQPRKINIRRMTKEHGKRYIQIAGGANWLFNSHMISPNKIVVMVEGELDAISIAIGTHSGYIVPVATGSNTGARWQRWLALLSVAHKVLLCFDDDQAGDDATKWWGKYLKNSKRIRPLGHDANDMLTSGVDMVGWILKAVS